MSSASRYAPGMPQYARGFKALIFTSESLYLNQFPVSAIHVYQGFRMGVPVLFATTVAVLAAVAWQLFGPVGEFTSAG